MAIQMQSQNFQHILRMCNTNVDGRQKVMFALTAIKGIGRRFSNIVCKKCDIDLNKRAGELTTDEVNKIVAVLNNPLQFKIPAYMLNRNRDVKDGKTSQKYSNFLDSALRDDLERMKRVRLHRGLRHYWGIKVRGQHTCTSGRHKRVDAEGKH
eukprot:CAMPEP_0194478402 /NCGR_PEP_ID=MMETSP0253-20130528/1857_1 /TAXON_ID=2966 /ORGANISM="Noctiluca scintillans" /LENGTH=152 /DNA_ID=CAMNT_0039317483 /DNA_START=56 /DNA_END=514 /DNA_ORIENTATION=+